MKYRYLGNTNTQVSVICLGTMTFGEQNTEAEGHAQLDFAVENGVNFIDTAELYSVPPKSETYGATEKIIGTWIKNRKKRDDIIIATKIVGPTSSENNAPPPLSWIRGGATRFKDNFLEEAVNDSLKRLQCDYIDVYQLHWPDRGSNFFGAANYVHNEEERMTPIIETLSKLKKLVDAGKIRYIGLSNETPWGLAEFLRLSEKEGLPRVISVQNPYNLLNRIYEIGLAEFSIRNQCGLLPYSPLAFGVLSGKYLNNSKPANSRLALFPDYKRYLSDKANHAVFEYATLAYEHNLDFAQMAIAFTVQQPFVTSSIIGATNLEQLKSNINAANLTISPDLMEKLNSLGNKHFNPCP